ncbi:MAG: phenylalanine--tRNA ligase subunit beta [Patescibacteria group bacterium]
MLVSYSWLQSYFKKKLPSPEKLADMLTFLAFEVEGIEEKKNDTIFNVKILPDRAHYALSHRGIARDLKAALGEEIVLSRRRVPESKKLAPLSVLIEDKKDCRRYIGRRVDGVVVGESPAWLTERLESIGQRSINNVVDAANFVMFDIGQPLHVFDGDKVESMKSKIDEKKIFIRRAMRGENIVSLDDRNIELNPEMLVIADAGGPLGIAGIKGGRRAVVGPETKNLILEAAHFNPAPLRRASERLGIRTDASKRFENEPSPELAAIAILEFSSLIAELCPGANFGDIVDEYPSPQIERIIVIQPEDISEKLGIALSAKEIADILQRLGIKVSSGKDKEFVLHIPPERLDLIIPEDIAEEVGRLIGYEKIPVALPSKPSSEFCIKKQFYWEWKIREFLANEGFSEVMTSSFSEKGVMAIEKPLAEDKAYLRTDLTHSTEEALCFNLTNLPLLGAPQVKIFEVGKIFPKQVEQTSLCIGIAQPKGYKGEKVNEQIRVVRDKIISMLGAPVSTACTVNDIGGIILFNGKPIGEINRIDGILELNLDPLIAALPDAKTWDISIPPAAIQTYKPLSLFPFIVRDIAFFSPPGVKLEDIQNCIKKNASLLARRVSLFDRFEKNGKTSLAFRIVFQADDRTLTDEEANAIMKKVSAALEKKFSAEIR